MKKATVFTSVRVARRSLAILSPIELHCKHQVEADDTNAGNEASEGSGMSEKY